jgi:hypothetical protein
VLFYEYFTCIERARLWCLTMKAHKVIERKIQKAPKRGKLTRKQIKDAVRKVTSERRNNKED